MLLPAVAPDKRQNEVDDVSPMTVDIRKCQLWNLKTLLGCIFQQNRCQCSENRAYSFQGTCAVCHIMPDDLNQQAPKSLSSTLSVRSDLDESAGGWHPSSSLSTERLHEANVEGSDPNQAGSRWIRYLNNARWLLLDQWFLLALGILILIASQVQVSDSQQEVKETVVTYLAVAVIFFITGCTLPTKVLQQNYSRWRLHLFAQIQSFLLTSAIIFGVVSACATNPDFLDPGLMVGLIFTGCVPTTISSNIIMTGQANGNQALTTVESTLGNFLGPFITPLLLLMYTSTGAYYTKFLPGLGSGDFGELYKRVFKQLGLSLFLPLVSQTRAKRESSNQY